MFDLLGMADSVDDGVDAGSDLQEHGGKLADHGCDQVTGTELSHKNRDGVGHEGQKPKADCGHGNLGNLHLGALCI